MTRLEVDKLLNTVDLNYKNYFKGPINEFSDYWYEYLYQYDFIEVEKKLRDCMSMDQFQYQPPTLEYLIKDLVKIQDKVDFNKTFIYCQFCNRIFNSIETLHKHEDRCRSVRYIVRQYKKYFNREVNKRELYEMSDEDFDEKYDKLLRFIEQHTTDEKEKKVIGFIFKVPSKEDARKVINS